MKQNFGGYCYEHMKDNSWRSQFITISTCKTGKATQHWKWEKSGRYWRIKNVGSGKYITSNESMYLKMKLLGQNQLWEEIKCGRYKSLRAVSGYYLKGKCWRGSYTVNDIVSSDYCICLRSTRFIIEPV